MRKFTFSNHEIDLNEREITVVTENHWFSDSFFTKFSFPVELVLTPELNMALGNIVEHTSQNIRSYIDGYYYEFGAEHKAVLELERLTNVASFVIRFGFEELPNWNKKLAALPLDRTDITGTTIRAHATSLLNTSFPVVNYAFPQIHINALDSASAQWQYFSERINARDNGAFLTNDYDVVRDEQVNRTIMQPLPHILHVIQAGFADLGFTVNGDIFSDPAFAKAYIFHFSEYYRSFTGDNVEFTSDRAAHNGTRYVNPNNGQTTADFNFAVQTAALVPGVYVVSGTAISYGDQDYIRFQIGNRVLFRGDGLFGIARKDYYIDFTFEVLPGGDNVLKVFAAQFNYIVDFEGSLSYNDFWLDVTVGQIARYDINGNLVSALIDASIIDLRKCVPDITFGQFMTILKNRFAIDIVPQGLNYRIDLVKNQIDANEIIDLSGYEARYPERTSTQGDTYVLKYPDIDSEDFTDRSLLISRDGVEPLDSQSLGSDTQEVPIDFLPLPLKAITSRRTAVQLEDDASALYIVRYDGLQNGENMCVDSGLALLDGYNTYLSRVYDYIINAKPYQFSVVLPELLAKQIKQRSRIFIYNQIFVIKKTQTTNLGRSVVQVKLDLIAAI